MKCKLMKTFALILMIILVGGCVDNNDSSKVSSSSSSSKPSSTVSSSVVDSSDAIKIEPVNGEFRAEHFIHSEKCQLENTQDIGGGKNVGWIENGTLLRYKLNIQESGYYQIAFRVAGDGSNTIGNKLHFYIDNKLVTSVFLIATGGWQVWEDAIEFGQLEKGIHIAELRSTGEGYNLNKVKFNKVAESKEEYETGDFNMGDVIRENAVEVYYSSSVQPGSGNWYKNPMPIPNKLSKQESLSIHEVNEGHITTINVRPEIKHQTMLGIGTSLEESSIYQLSQLKPEIRTKFLRDLIDPVNGAGMTFFRVTIGTADFTAQDDFYTYYDEAPVGEPDWENGFSIQKDIDLNIISTVQELLEIAEELGVREEIRIFGSSWTPPGWMKEPTSNSSRYPNNEKLLKGGRLKDEHIDNLAMYYVRFVEEYAKKGIPIYAITLQNEPLLEIDYPSCLISASQAAKLAISIKNKVSESSLLTSLEINPKLWAFDHNFSEAKNYVRDMFKVNGAKEAIDGIAFHDYSGSPTIMQEILDDMLDGDQTVAMTERSVWGVGGASRIIEYLRNGSVSYNAWVTMLDSNIQIHHWVGTPGPTLFIRRAGSDENYWATPEVYIFGNFARFIRPGYERVDSDPGSAYTVSNVIYQDPVSRKFVGVFTNRTNETQRFKVRVNDYEFLAELPANNVATFIWK